MDSPSRNPLLQNQQDEISSEDESQESLQATILENNTYIATSARSSQPAIKERRPSAAPVDTYNISFLIFYLLGMVTLLPWNFFITAEEYWQYKFRNLTSNDSSILTPRQIEFQPDIAICSSIPTTIFLVLNAFFSHKISLKLRMVGSMVIVLILFLITTMFVKINTDDYQDYFFEFTLTTVFVINIFSAILSGGLFGIAGMFSSRYITAVIGGQALGGIFTALAEVISITFATDPIVSAFIYFLVGTVILVSAIFLYIYMSKTLFFKFHINQSHIKANTFSINNETGTSEITATTIASVNRNYLQPDWKKICGKIWMHGSAVWLCAVTTLSVFPAITVLVKSVDYGHGYKWNDVYFLPVINYLVFNTGDYLGRIISGWVKWPNNNPKLVTLLTVLRIAFVPALLLCNITQKHPLPILFHSDEIFIALMIGFAFTNGYIANISCIFAPAVVEEHEKEMTSSMMAAFIGLGLTVGSAISFVLIQFVS
ncbi:equilibrative nucleoside transporter 1 [Chironomus tepperi]|uniref:equilibrative nucleoside transporter 1 n=1 Tax=Chironomus tepperi TaxID=113505 RepID=UPI00391F01DE